VDEAVTWLGQSPGRRFFAWVHLFEPHAPYGNPDADRPAKDRYADDVSEADRQVQRLVDALRDRRRSTAIVVASDHGEAFGEHGEVAHSIFVYDTTLRVPLIVVAPGVTPRRETAAVSLADLAPTISSLAGLGRWDGDGTDLRVADAGALARVTGRALYAESFAPLVDFGWSSLRSLRSNQWKYIAAPRPELYDIENDPAEEHDLAEQEAAVAADLAARVRGISGAELPNAASPELDPDARRRLQALGYASGSRTGSAGRRRDPKDARALAAAIAAMLSGDVRGEALGRAIRAVLAEDPGNPQANLRLGYLYVQAARCKDAEPLFARAIAGGAAGADAHLGLATCQGRRGATAEALRSLEQARAREPQNAVVIANIGIALGALNEHGRAVAALREALGIDPDLHEARFNLALSYARAGDREGARREAEALLDRLPPDAPQRPEVERLVRALQ
jgi:tetratricopeptide (TPR) repeat protein